VTSMNFDYLYDEMERPFTRYVSFATKNKRYDLALIYTQHFDGKTVVMSVQNLQGVLISADDISHTSAWTQILQIDPDDIEIVKEFLRSRLYSIDRLMDQY
jgi:hypothetical protein